jgi:hypothetical protein
MSGHRPWRLIRRRPRYLFTIEPDGEHWLVRTDDLVNVFTQVEDPADAPAAARSVTALMLDVPADSFDVEVRLVGAEAVTAEHVRSARERLELAEEYLAAATGSAVAELSAARLSMRDIGQVVGLSHQRVAQLVAAQRTPVEAVRIDELMAALEASVAAAREQRDARRVTVPLAAAEKIA